MILPNEKIIYIHVPKTGGISVEDFLLKKFNHPRGIFTLTNGVGVLPIHTENRGQSYYPLMHYPLKDIITIGSEFKIDNSWKIFSIVRNPYYKFISELFWFSKTGMDNHYHTLPLSSKTMFINDTIDKYFNKLDFYYSYHSFHSYPQYKFFENTDLNYQIFKFEEGLENIMVKLGFEVNNDFPHTMDIFTERRIPKPNYKDVLTPYLVEIVNEKYAKDFEVFGYDMLSPLDI